MSSGRKGAVVVALVVAVAAPAATAAGPASSERGGSATATVAAKCKKGKIARIAGKRTCLTKGKRCQPRYQKQYKRNGYICKRNSAGEYRLKKRKQEF
jgi:hypothetical protein